MVVLDGTIVNIALPSLVRRPGHGPPSGSTTRDYAYDPNGDPLTLTTGGKAYYYTHDWLGSASDLTDAAGTPQYAYTYEPYGGGAGAAPAPLTATAPANPLRYTGAYIDPTGSYYLRARQYDPATGRFDGTDPAKPQPDVPTTGSYIYAGDDPTAATDPTGEFPKLPCPFGTNPDGTCRGHGLAEGASRAVTDFEVGVVQCALSLAARDDVCTSSVLTGIKTSIADCAKGFEGGGANPLNQCVRQVAGINDIIEGLQAIFSGCSDQGAYQATSGLINLALLFLPYGKGLPKAAAETTIRAAEGASRDAVDVLMARRAADLRTKLHAGGGRNVAVAWYDIDTGSGELVSVSGRAPRAGTVSQPEPPFTLDPGTKASDTEWKILETLSRQLNSGSRGGIVLYTERSPCPSCAHVIQEFRSKFPGVNLDVRSG
jgi:RHS repeat-associated protein